MAAGAFGAHGLQDVVDDRGLELWRTGARYQQIHAVALLVVGLSGSNWSKARTVAALAFTFGVLVFSGTLYGLALGGPRVLGAITPIGGLSLIFGWGALVWHGLKHVRSASDAEA